VYKEVILQYLKAYHKPFTIVGDEIRCSCLNPQHLDRSPSFSINHRTGLMGCFSCGYKNHITNLVEHTEDLEEMERTSMYLQSLEALEDLDTPIDALQGPVMLPPNSGIPIPLEGIRGVSKEVLDRMEIFYCARGKYKGRLIAPVKDSEGVLLGFDARIYTPVGHDKIDPINPKAKYLRPSYMKTAKMVYGLYKASYSDTVILTEGVFDALSWQELGYNAVCNFGLLTMTPEKAGMLYAAGVTKIMFGFDNDPAGIQGVQKIKEDVRQYFEIVKPNDLLLTLRQYKGLDINDYLIKLKEDDG